MGMISPMQRKRAVSHQFSPAQGLHGNSTFLLKKPGNSLYPELHLLVCVQEQVFICFSPISLAELEQITEKHEGEMAGEFSCSWCNFKSYGLLQEHSGQSMSYVRACVPLRAHLHRLLLGHKTWALELACVCLAWSSLTGTL